MPVIHVRMLPQREGVDLPAVMGSMCRAVAALLRAPERAVWATWEVLPAGNYVEGGTPARTQPHASHPPIVTITMFEGRTQETIEAVLRTIAAELSHGLGIEDGNAFVTYVEAAKGRVFTGGDIRR